MSAAAPRIAVVTSAGMQYPDPEAPIVADALRETGADARLWAWDAPADWGGFDLVLVRSPWDYFDRRHEPTSLELETSRLAMSCAPGPLTYARVDLVDVDGVPTLMELEVIEPDLFFRADPESLGRFVTAVTAEL